MSRVKNQICLWMQNFAFWKTWHQSKHFWETGHVLRNAKFCIQREIWIFTWQDLMFFVQFLVACYATIPHFVRWSVGWLVSRLVCPLLLFRHFWAFWAHCSCPNAPVTFSITAPAHPHATRVAVYPALFILILFSTKSDFVTILAVRKVDFFMESTV